MKRVAHHSSHPTLGTDVVGNAGVDIHPRDSTSRHRHNVRHQLPIPSSKKSRSRIIWIFVAFATTFLIGVHIFLFRVLTSNQATLMNEFAISDTKVTVIQQQPQPQRRNLTPLRQLDYEVYTIRINSWKRLDQLQTSIQHHASCPGAVQIQIVWCIDQGEPPDSLLDNDKVVIERHSVNSLNERFRILEETPTLGILSMDDDVLRPCDAIDAGFFKWTQNPHRMVGFDGRSHTIVSHGREQVWEYAYLSETEHTNRYSMSLPRYAFLHRDYLNWYMTDLPRPIFDRVAKHFNCEDIAMSFFVSYLTNGEPPLLADKWASLGTQIKLYSHHGGISDSLDHKALRDACMNDFADILQLKGKLHHGRYIGPGMFSCGVDPQYQPLTPSAVNGIDKTPNRSVRQQKFDAMRTSWETMASDVVIKTLMDMKSDAMVQAYWSGLIADTEPWEKRWNLKGAKTEDKKGKKKKNRKKH